MYVHVATADDGHMDRRFSGDGRYDRRETEQSEAPRGPEAADNNYHSMKNYGQVPVCVLRVGMELFLKMAYGYM